MPASCDAIVCGRDYPDIPGEDRDVARNRIFGPMLGVARVKSREVFNRSFVTRVDDDTTFLFPKNNPRHPEARHDWRIAHKQGGEFLIGDAIGSDQIDQYDVVAGTLKD